MTSTRPAAGPDAPKSASFEEDAGYHKSLRPRQIQMIAIGGAIGTGLFLGAGGRLAHAGPGLFLVYGICGVFVFFVLRALGELVLHRPSSGSFVSYAREFYGEKLAFAVGWMYFFHWCMTGIVDITAIAAYAHYWGAFEVVPQWVIALIALLLVLAVNMISVRWFGELEFWAALIKVVTLVGFLIIGTVFLAARYDIDGASTGPSVITDSGGLFPTGMLPLILVTTGVVFAYSGVELVGTAAGETENPEKIMPRAINSIIARIALFYVGSLVLLALLLPYTVFRAGESPFVTFFSRIGIDGAGSVVNMVVMTAAFSSLNAGLYSTGRVLRSMAMNGSAPGIASRMSSRGVPYIGILATGAIALIGVGLNAVVPEQAFEIVLNLSALGTLSTWAAIVLCQLKLWDMSRKGLTRRPDFQLIGSPYTGIATLLFLVGVVVVMACSDDPVQRGAVIAAVLVVVPAFTGGWFLVRSKVLRIAETRSGITGQFPVIAERPRRAVQVIDESRPRDE
ncbi:L-asparagine permease 1 [Nocardia neocaledoniensis NBRC 108232]|uniref:Asparagine:proton symporter (AAT family) n=1 Tax=Nocardia neocaledoniensis TaxID=236511 RepID=A0A317N104_9NOCA|nr:amino acid permease [Nocardia neocaledoniensis]PWV66972.1 asparagine:proton symporter (AAT family) [Nocardia neocaledoniensis]GEM31291.1 L-asparagine permease 1 [Nocardia neocaledoniensis NBRC 108232]